MTSRVAATIGLHTMAEPRQVSFDQYLDILFASSGWLDACVNMLSVFLEDIECGRDNPAEALPGIAPSIVDQVAAVAGRARRLEHQFRVTAEKRGPEFQTTQLGAVLWWAGMASHKADAALEDARGEMARNDWQDAFIQINLLLYDTVAALSLLSVAEGMIRRMETEGIERERQN